MDNLSHTDTQLAKCPSRNRWWWCHILAFIEKYEIAFEAQGVGWGVNVISHSWRLMRCHSRSWNPRWVKVTRWQKWLLRPFYHASLAISLPKFYNQTSWRSLISPGNATQQQLFCHGDITPSVNISAIFDAATSCCGDIYCCGLTRLVPSLT